MKHLFCVLLVTCVCLTASAAPLFEPGDLFWGRVSAPTLFNVTDGGSFDFQAPFANFAGNTASQYGQLAFHEDRSVAYATVYSAGKVVAIRADGTVSDFATGISAPTGVVRTSSGRTLVSTLGGRVFDITSGGAFGAAPAYAWGLSSARNMVETADGVYVIDQGSGKVVKLAAGNLAGSTGFAWGLSNPLDLVSHAGRLYVSAMGTQAVYDITAGGNYAGAAAFATGNGVAGLAATGGRLYASSSSAETGRARIWDITSGGAFTNSATFAYNLPGFGDSLFDAVPTSAVTAIPEPSTLALCGFALAGLSRLRRAR